MGIQPNMKPIYNYGYLSPDYVPKVNVVEPNSINLVCETSNVEAEKEAQSIIPLSSDEEKKLSTLMLTKNNSLNTISISSNPEIITTTNNDGKGEIENNNVSVETKENNNDNIIKNPQNIKANEIKPYPVSLISKPQLKHSKSTSHISKEKQPVSVRKSKSLPNLNEGKKSSSSKHQQKQKFLKKLKHKKQPKIIYPSIPVNPNLSFVPLYKKNESKIERRVKHSDMENTYKKLKVEVQQKSK